MGIASLHPSLRADQAIQLKRDRPPSNQRQDRKRAGFRRPFLVEWLLALGYHRRRSFAFADLGTPSDAHKRENRSGCNH